jgi:ATP-dependent DNA ligase
LPLGKRKTRLARLPARVAPGIELNEHTEADGAAVFRQACKMGLEGMVPAGQLVAALLSGKQRS